MLESSWESHATTFANASSSEDFVAALQEFVSNVDIDLTKPAKVVYARDTRPSGPILASAFEDGLKAIGAEGRNAGVTSTPVLHYLVRSINTKGTDEAYGDDSEEGYFLKLSGAFKLLTVCQSSITQGDAHASSQNGLPAIPPLIVDCANGVGATTASKLSRYIGDTLPFVLHNTAITTPGALNSNCGADFVKTQQTLPPSLAEHMKQGQRGCSLDGDADRLMYFYLNDKGQFRMLDGDKIGALVAAFIGELAKAAGLEEKIKVGIVQTAYANGASTKYLSAVRDIILLSRQCRQYRLHSVCPFHACQLASNTCTMLPRASTLVYISRRTDTAPFCSPLRRKPSSLHTRPPTRRRQQRFSIWSA